MIQGETTSFSYLPPQIVKNVSKNDTISNLGSYLTKSDSFLTVQLFDGSWLRVDPESKFALDYDPTKREIEIHLLKGSLKSLFSTSLNKGKVQKLIVKSGDAIFETTNGKFSVIRNSLSDSSTLYVEKGLVMAIQTQRGEKKDMELVHAQETVSVKDRQMDIAPAHLLTEKEMSYLKSNSHLKFKKSTF